MFQWAIACLGSSLVASPVGFTKKVEISMKTLFFGSCVLVAVGLAGCGESSTEGPQAATPASSSKPEKVVVMKPTIPGEAEHTFSLSVPFEAIALTQGDDQEVRIGINRGENFGEEVAIEVSGLPAGVTVEPAESVIPHGSTGVSLTLKASQDAALGSFSAEVKGHTKSSSADFTQVLEITIAPVAGPSSTAGGTE